MITGPTEDLTVDTGTMQVGRRLNDCDGRGRSTPKLANAPDDVLYCLLPSQVCISQLQSGVLRQRRRNEKFKFRLEIPTIELESANVAGADRTRSAIRKRPPSPIRSRVEFGQAISEL